MKPDTRKRAIIALRAMFKNAKSIKEVDFVRFQCKTNKVNFAVLFDMPDHTFQNAMEFNQVEEFYI